MTNEPATINDIAAKVAEIVIAARVTPLVEGETVSAIHTATGVYHLTGPELRRFKRMLREASAAYAKDHPNRHERRKREAQR